MHNGGDLEAVHRIRELAAKPTVSLRDLADRPMVLLDPPATQDYFLGYFRAYGLHPDIRYRLRSFEMNWSVVGVGIGFSFGFRPLTTTRSYLGHLLVRRPLDEPVPGPNVCLAYVKDMLPTRG